MLAIVPPFRTVMEIAECGLIQLDVCDVAITNFARNMMNKVMKTGCRMAQSDAVNNFALSSTAIYCAASVAGILGLFFVVYMYSQWSN